MKIEEIASIDFSGGLQRLLEFATRIQSAGDFVFFRLIMKSLRKQIDEFGAQLLSNMMAWVGGVALVLMTLWLLIQGYRIVTGQSRDSMMALVTNMARSALIISVATSMALFGTNLQDFLVNDVNQVITKVVTKSDESAEKQIDDALAYMQLALASIDSVQVEDDAGLSSEKLQAQLMVGMGTGGPAVVAGSMLLLYQIAMALFIGLGPLFILCLLFDQTKSLFQRWLMYGLGTMFSMAVLAAMVGIALKMVINVAIAFWTRQGIETLFMDGSTSDMTSQALQQGGMGLILTTLILTAPPMAAMFFQGTLGSFMAYSQIGGAAGAQPGPQGQSPGSYAPAQAKNGSISSGDGSNPVPQETMARNVGQQPISGIPTTGKLGRAQT
jgi:type IV secretion system protein VirB6